ncbi:MAG: TIGR01212 family radical SAM protein [Alistipes sp.]|nr:TIGR01212 family radical SAM protein [Alistipes sp.]
MEERQIRPWGDTRPWHSYAAYCRRLYGGAVRKIAVDAGMSCPNRDGTIGREGCAFCDNRAFTPSYCSPDKPLRQQIDEGIAFHEARGRTAGRCLAYFQPHSNTHAPVGRLAALYGEALAHPRIEGLVIGTRPDCLDGPRLDLLAWLGSEHPLTIEFGIESTDDRTLRAIGRGHDFAAAQRAVEACAARGLQVGAHFILGFPEEDGRTAERLAERINALPLATVKFHQLQILRGTPLAVRYDADPGRFPRRSPEQYVELLCELLRRLRPDIAVERIVSEVPPRYRHASLWQGLRGADLWAMLEKKLTRQQAYQGENFIPLPR